MPMSKINEFITASAAGKSVVFEAVDPHNGEKRRQEFSLMGLRKALRKLSCLESLSRVASLVCDLNWIRIRERAYVDLGH